MNPDASSPKVQATTDVPLLAGRYQVLDKLGEGGMGTVFLARDTKLDRAVAVKILPVGSVHDAEAVARFQREARALARLSHPGIIQAYDNGADGNQHFLVMEFVQGQSLAREPAERGRISPTRSADYGHQAALALHHAHQHGLIHRDVKPSNLLLAPDGRVKLLDLGLARFLQDQVGDASLTREGAGMGTPDYAAPEQFRDAHKADPRSDVYSLGCTLYHLIAGRVPFPGSSLSEKVQAHETKEPPPLEELCPDVPMGLTLAVQRMMAKRPADRFQSMAELADALAPYVAGTSLSSRDIRATSTWDSSRLATMIAPPRRRVRTPWLIAGATMLMIFAVGFVGLLAGWFRPGTAQVAGNADTLSSGAGERSPAGGEAKADQGSKMTAAWYADDPNVLTVSKDEKSGGQFRTIGAALDKVNPGMTIRVLDDAVYPEALIINHRARHGGITLEAPRHAFIEVAARVGLLITGVPRVTVRGLRFRVLASNATGVLITGHCPGAMLDQLEIDLSRAVQGDGISFESVELDRQDPPAEARDCLVLKAKLGFSVYGNPAPSRRILIRDNRIEDPGTGIFISGAVQQVHIAANRISGATLGGIQFQHLSDSADGLLVANNTVFDSGMPFRLWDREVKAKNVRLCNNLFLGRPETPDMVFIDSGGDDFKPRGPGVGELVEKAWRIGHNGREAESDKSWGKDRIPPGKTDLVREWIDVLSREASSPDFLRPPKDSTLATAGAGEADPSLPRYIGAVPPAGTDRWDWDRARRMPKDAQLLTVSKESSAGGKYRSIKEALKDARPWATIRVLDSGTYEEAIVLNDRKKHEGLTLEAVKGATMQMADGVRRLIAIEDVSHIRLTGFSLIEKSTRDDVTRAFVVVSGKVPGVALTRLALAPDRPMFGILLQNVDATSTEPLRIGHCTIRPRVPKSTDAISIVGSIDSNPAGGICICSNRIFNSIRGVNLRGSLRQVHVVGNMLVNCPFVGVQLEDLSLRSRGVLVGNNTVLGGQMTFRVWDNIPYEDPVAGQVEVANNVVFAASECDVGYLLDPGKGETQMHGNGKMLLNMWRFHHNRRDFSGADTSYAIPLAPDDARLKRDELLYISADDIDRVRPEKNSPLATQGAGTRDGTLPVYIGALPREGDPAWDWNRPWRARVKKDVEKK